MDNKNMTGLDDNKGPEDLGGLYNADKPPTAGSSNTLEQILIITDGTDQITREGGRPAQGAR
jgi:hypothetical protein